MKYELGISVYPDLRPLEEIEAYFELASRYSVSKVFSQYVFCRRNKRRSIGIF